MQAMSSDQVVVEHVPVGLHAIGQHDQDLIYIGGNQFFPATGGRAFEQIAAGQDAGDDMIALIRILPLHIVAAYS